MIFLIEVLTLIKQRLKNNLNINLKNLNSVGKKIVNINQVPG